MTLHRETIPSVADETNAERKKIIAALHRLFTTNKPRTVSIDDRLVIDTLRKEADVSRAALTHRHIDLKDLFLDCVAEREQEGQDLRTPKEAALEEHVAELTRKNRELQDKATHWEGAARDLARTVAALQSLYATASARLDAVVAEATLEREERKLRSNVSPYTGRDIP